MIFRRPAIRQTSQSLCCTYAAPRPRWVILCYWLASFLALAALCRATGAGRVVAPLSTAGIPGGGWHPATLTLTRLFHGFNCRSDKSIFAIKFTSNTWSIWAFLAGVVLLALVMVVPVLSRLFSVAALDRSQLLSILGLAFLPTLVIQMVKAIRDKVRG